MICIVLIMSTESQYTETRMFFTSMQQWNVFSVWHGRLTANWRYEMPFQTFGAATQNARLAVSVHVDGTERRGASVDCRDRVVTWRCRSSSMYGGTEVDKALCVMTAILYWMRCWTGSHWRDCNNGLAWTHLRCWQMTLATLFWALCT